ncbi:MAG: Crp/Fnr family transcriptional regulator, partial [Comamonadaceae bacterium]
MTMVQQAHIRNHLLASLSAEDFALLEPQFEPVSYELRQTVFRAGEAMGHVLFPESGLISIVADIEQGRFEVGMAGWEGMVGVPLVLGVEHTPHTAIVQVPGHGLQLSVEHMQLAIMSRPSLNQLLLRYVHTYIVQIAQTAYVNAAYDIEPRLARWILMTHDRTEGDEIVLTHEFLATMLGTARPGVTFAVQRLESNGLIRAMRGRMVIRNRAALEELAGNAYG